MFIPWTQLNPAAAAAAPSPQATNGWAGPLFLQYGLLLPGAPSSSAPGLVEALSDFLASDAILAPAFPGGWTNGDAGRDAVTPYGVFLKARTARRQTIKAGYSVDRVTVHLLAVDTSAEGAEAAARTLKARLLPSSSYTPPALLFQDGAEPGGSLGRHLDTSEGGEVTALDPARGPLNADVWHSVVPITFRVARGG